MGNGATVLYDQNALTFVTIGSKRTLENEL